MRISPTCDIPESAQHVKNDISNCENQNGIGAGQGFEVKKDALVRSSRPIKCAKVKILLGGSEFKLTNSGQGPAKFILVILMRRPRQTEDRRPSNPSTVYLSLRSIMLRTHFQRRRTHANP
jgi:hypothetical protein